MTWIVSLNNSEAFRLVEEYTEGNRPWSEVELIGTNAVTHLERKLKAHPTPFSKIYRILWVYLPSRIGAELGRPIKHDQVRAKAAEGLFRLNKKAASSMPALLQCLNDPVEDVRLRALDAIESMEGENTRVITAVKTSIKYPVPAHGVIWQTASRGGKVIGIRKTLSQAKNYRYLIAAAQLLTRLDSAERPFATHLLEEHITDQATPIPYRIQSFAALTNMDPTVAKSQVHALLEILKTPGIDLHSSQLSRLVSLLNSLTPDSRIAAPEILRIIQDIQEDTGLEGLLINCVGVVGELDPSLPKTLPVLQTLSDHANKNVRSNAIYSVTQLNFPNNTLLPVMEFFLNDEDPGIRAFTAGNLYRKDSQRYQHCLQILEEILDEEERQPRTAALYELMEIKNQVEHLLPKLRKMLAGESHPLMILDIAKAILNISSKHEPLTLKKVKTLTQHQTQIVRDLATNLIETYRNE